MHWYTKAEFGSGADALDRYRQASAGVHDILTQNGFSVGKSGRSEFGNDLRTLVLTPYFGAEMVEEKRLERAQAMLLVIEETGLNHCITLEASGFYDPLNRVWAPLETHLKKLEQLVAPESEPLA